MNAELSDQLAVLAPVNKSLWFCSVLLAKLLAKREGGKRV